MAPRDERLSWLTGFTGSAGICVATLKEAALFADSRYTLQAASQTDTEHFEQKNIPNDHVKDWLAEHLKASEILAFDPWLHSKGEIDALRDHLSKHKITLKPSANLVDEIWENQPDAPNAPIVPHPDALAGQSHDKKRKEIAEILRSKEADAVVLTLPDSIAWLLNIRGSDIERTPVPLAFAILHATQKVELFTNPSKLDKACLAHLGPEVTITKPESFSDALKNLKGRIMVDKNRAPIAVSDLLSDAEIIWERDPTLLPKACKNPVELQGSREAHQRDGSAMIEFLTWLDREAPKGELTEIKVAQKLEDFRRATNALKDISFESISGAGPNGAIVHYRVNTDTDRPLKAGELFLIDSGGQYEDGTTDITRTISLGPPPKDAVTAFTAVLKGMIAISMARFPQGLAGRDIDAFARHALWSLGLDYDHGTGHGVGSYLGVHEGPASISKRSHEPLCPGMILSNEPGYYKKDHFGIRIENLIAVNAPKIPKGGEREMLSFETLSYVPIDRRLIDPTALNGAERDWLNSYHSDCLKRHSDHVSSSAKDWLINATKPVETALKD